MDDNHTSAGDEGAHDEEDQQQVLKQQEFPSWIGNKEYLPTSYASPSNTLLQALDRDRNKAPVVFEIFAGASSQSGNSSNDESPSNIDLKDMKRDMRKRKTDKDNMRRENKTESPSQVFPARPSSRQEAAAAINPAFVPDTDPDLHHHPVTKL